MLTEVTQRQRESYPEQGFLVVGKFLGDAELREWLNSRRPGRRRAGTAAVFLRARRVRRIRRPARPREEQEYYGQAFTQRNNPWQTDQEVRRLLLQPALGKYVDRIWPESTPGTRQSRSCGLKQL